MFWPFRSRTVTRTDDGPPPSIDTLDDTALIERARRRDAVAFGVLYERHLDRIYRYVVYRTGSATVAEDLTSEVFLNAWKSMERYEDRGHPFTTWLLRLAHNEVADYFRTHRNDVTLLETDTHHSSLPEPGDFIDTQGDTELLLRVVRQLPEEWRQVILLRFVEELPFDEVALIVGKSSGACRVIQHRALARLRELLAIEENVGGG